MEFLISSQPQSTRSEIRMAWQLLQSNWLWRKKRPPATATGTPREPKERLNDQRQWNTGSRAYLSDTAKEQRMEAELNILHAGKKVGTSIYITLLQDCIDRTLVEGELVHGHMIKTGFVPGVFLRAKLVIMYTKCCSLEYARQVFDKMLKPNVVLWNAMITDYVQNERVEDARRLFDEMHGRNVVSWNAMIAGYVQNGRAEDARQLFDQMPERNVISWNAMIAGYAATEQGGEALKAFSTMQGTGMEPNQSTFSSILAACASLADLKRGQTVHALIIKTVSEPDVFVGSALVDMYSKCRSIDSARLVFDKMSERNVVSWTAMVVAYAQNGRIKDAYRLFEKMPEHNVVSWTAMIAGYAQNEHYEEALGLYSQMQRAGMKLKGSTFSSVLGACASLASLELGKQIHGQIIKMLFESDVFIGTALVDMYSKCGNIYCARHVFDKMTERNVVSWTAMIIACGQHGLGNEALQLFELMQHANISPNYITFVGVLSACSHAGLLDEAWQYFDSMNKDYRITPTAEHYACMVDLLGRMGYLDEAENFINQMPFKPDAVVWGALLGACRIHVNTQVGKRAAQQIFELEPNDRGTCVLLSNICASAGMWDDVARVRRMMKERDLKNNTGCSWIKVKNRVHAFHAGDNS